MSTMISQENTIAAGAASFDRHIEQSGMTTLTRFDDTMSSDVVGIASAWQEFARRLALDARQSDSWSYATLFMADVEAPLNQWFWEHRGIDQYKDVASISHDHEEKILLHIFAKGSRGPVEPNQDTINMAYRILRASFATKMEWREIVCSDNDGTLMFELELPNGKSIDAELESDGKLNASTFYVNSDESSTEYWLDITEQEFLDLIRSEDKWLFPAPMSFVDSYVPVKATGVHDTTDLNPTPSRTTIYQYGTLRCYEPSTRICRTYR